MKILDERTARALVTLLIFIAVAVFIYAARDVLIAFLFAILFAYVLNPWVSQVERWKPVSRGSRTLAALEVYAVLIVALSISAILFAPLIADEGQKLATELPLLFEKMSSGQLAREIGAKHGWSYRTQLDLQRFLRQHSEAILPWMGKAASQVASLLPNLLWVVLVPIVAFFFLTDGRVFVTFGLEIVDAGSRRDFASAILSDLNEMMAQYIRVQLIITGLALAFYMGLLSVLRVPYALILGAIAGVLEFLPTLGPALGAAVILVVAFLAGYKHLVIVVVCLGAWRIVQDYVTFPRLAGSKLKLHPLAAIFAILVGAEIGGIAGAYLSIPVLAGIRIIQARWQRRFARERLSV